MTRQITFNGVGLAAAKQKNKLLTAFSRVIDSGVFLEGKENSLLTKSLAKRLGKGFVITVASGHDALLLSLQSLRLLPTDEIIYPINTYPTKFPVVLTRATPVPVDADRNGQLDPITLEKAITKNTRVVVVVHLYGHVGNLAAIITICRKHKLILIEDAAQAFGTTYANKQVGTLGDIGCFSFYPTKNLGALGDGGAIWTKNKKIATYVTQAKMYGETMRSQSRFASGHSRLPELQAAGLGVYLKNIDRIKTKRKRVFGWYTDELSKGNFSKFLRLVQSVPKSDPMPHLFVIVCTLRDKLQKYLAKHNIPTQVHYPPQPVLSLPFHEYLTRSDVGYIVSHIRSFYETLAP